MKACISAMGKLYMKWQKFMMDNDQIYLKIWQIRALIFFYYRVQCHWPMLFAPKFFISTGLNLSSSFLVQQLATVPIKSNFPSLLSVLTNIGHRTVSQKSCCEFKTNNKSSSSSFHHWSKKFKWRKIVDVKNSNIICC